MRRLSVTARIALLAIALSLVSNVALVIFIRAQVHRDAVGVLRRDMGEQADALVAVYRSGGAAALATAIDEARAPGDQTLLLAVFDPLGNRRIGVGPERVAATLLQPGFRIGRLGDDGRWARIDTGYAVRRVGMAWLVSGRQLDDWQREQRGIERALLVALALSLVLGVGAGIVLSRYVAARLHIISGTIDGVAAGNLNLRVDMLDGNDAFDRLARRLNAMLDRLAGVMDELRLITDGLAHDLRSPLARLRSKTEQALLLTDGQAREAALAGLLTETDLVMRMLSTLIEISRAEAVTGDRFVAVDPAELVEDIAELYAPVVEDAGITFTVAIDDRPASVAMHRELMTQAITNLIDNALKYAGGGGAITLRLARAGEALAISVEDRGPGIAPDDRAHALRRFGRLDAARTQPGAGLGMALVAAVARLHGGDFVLDDNAPGLIARITLPQRGGMSAA